MSTPLQGSLFFFFSFLKDVICSYTFVFWKRQSALPLFNQHMVLRVLVKVENSYPFSLIQYTANKLYIIFPQQVLSWLFLFLIFDFQREIIGHKAFWRKGENKKKSENEYFPAGQNISELVLYLQRITKHKRATKQDADISAQCSTPCAVGLSVPHL